MDWYDHTLVPLLGKPVDLACLPLDLFPSESYSVGAAEPGMPQQQERKEVLTRCLTQAPELRGIEWLRAVLGLVSWAPLAPHRIPHHEFAINGGVSENAMQDCHV